VVLGRLVVGVILNGLVSQYARFVVVEYILEYWDDFSDTAKPPAVAAIVTSISLLTSASRRYTKQQTQRLLPIDTLERRDAAMATNHLT